MPITDPDSKDRRYIVTAEDRMTSGYAIERVGGSHDYLVLLTVRGRGFVQHANGIFDVQANDIVLLRPGQYHRYGVPADSTYWHRLWAHFVPPAEWSVYLDWPQRAPGFHFLSLRDVAICRKVTAHLREADHLARGFEVHHEALALNALEAALIWCDRSNPEAELARLDPRIREALDFLSRNLHRPLTVDDVADHCSLSASRLAHLFREHVGETPQRFLEQQRIARARQLLEVSARSITEIAADVGYESPFYFSLRFKRHTGQSPRNYRRRFAQQ